MKKKEIDVEFLKYILASGMVAVSTLFLFIIADKEMEAPLAVGLFLQDPIGVWGSLVVRGLSLLFFIPSSIAFFYMLLALLLDGKNKK